MKYFVNYASAATGYGWAHEYDHISDFEDFVNEQRTDATAYISVYDNELGKCIFRKGYGYKPDVDFLKNPNRDLRTTTREHKLAV